MVYEHHQTDDQVATRRGPRGAALARETLPAYSSKFSRKDFTQHQLFAVLALKTFLKADYRGVAQVLADFAELRRTWAWKRSRTTRPSATPQAAAKKGEFVVLLFRAAARAREGGLIGPEPTAAVDATGLESRHTSRYFFNRAGRKHGSRVWTKLTVACDTASHFLAGARVSLGPANNAPQFRPVMAQASLAVGYDRVLADAAFDSEASHRYCREELGVRSTVIPLNRRGPGARMAQDPLSTPDGQAVPQTASRQPVQAHVRAALAGGERLLAAQAPARIGPARQVGRVAQARVLPACTHPQPHAPRRYRVEGFNRATRQLRLGGQNSSTERL